MVRIVRRVPSWRSSAMKNPAELDFMHCSTLARGMYFFFAV